MIVAGCVRLFHGYLDLSMCWRKLDSTRRRSGDRAGGGVDEGCWGAISLGSRGGQGESGGAASDREWAR